MSAKSVLHQTVSTDSQGDGGQWACPVRWYQHRVLEWNPWGFSPVRSVPLQTVPLLNELLPDAEKSKVNTCVENAFQVWEEGKADRTTQLIFCNLSTPKGDGTFNVFDDVRTFANSSAFFASVLYSWIKAISSFGIPFSVSLFRTSSYTLKVPSPFDAYMWVRHEVA